MEIEKQRPYFLLSHLKCVFVEPWDVELIGTQRTDLECFVCRCHFICFGYFAQEADVGKLTGMLMA